jgi:hypothetical protein
MTDAAILRLVRIAEVAIQDRTPVGTATVEVIVRVVVQALQPQLSYAGRAPIMAGNPPKGYE